MGNKYIEKDCPKCGEVTTHRTYKRFGKTGTGGTKSLRRTVTWCMKCQKRVIDNRRNRR